MKVLAFIFSTFWLFGCTNTSKEKEVFANAASIHNEMMKTVEAMEEQIATLEKDSINSVPPDSLTAWKEAIELWESDIVEVPGNEEHHDHKEGEHHQHDHKTVEVTAEQMLFIQQELSTRLASIKSRIEASIKK
jgi:hypothetical protein